MYSQRLGDKLPEQESVYNKPQIPKELAKQSELVSSIEGLFNELNQRLIPISKNEPVCEKVESLKDPPFGGMFGDLKPITRKLEVIRDRIQSQLRLLDI